MTTWRIADRTLDFGPPLAAGIVNVTDDSFFAGARSGTPERAIADGLALVETGFDLLDVGAVAARSGPAVDAADEAARLVPAVEGLVARAGVPVLADTFSPEVASAALDAGAAAINDIGGGADRDAGADRRARLRLRAHAHRGPAAGRPRAAPHYDDVVAHVRRVVRGRIERAAELGIDPERIALDPGLDFDLSADDDLELLRRLGELRELGRPLFVALSRKDFLGAIAAGSWERRLDAAERLPATLAATALAVAEGAEMLRLHDAEALDAMRTAAAITGVPG